MHLCCVPGCQSRSDKDKGVSFYRLPASNTELHYQWVTTARLNKVTKHSRICSIHFHNGKRDSPDDVPMTFPWSKKRKSPIVRPFKVITRPRKRHITTKFLQRAIEQDHNYCSSIRTPTTLTTIKNINISLPKEAIVSTSSDTPPPSPEPEATIEIPSPLHTPFRIEAIQDNKKLIHFYTAFTDYETLQVCYKFLGDSVNDLTY